MQLPQHTQEPGAMTRILAGRLFDPYIPGFTTNRLITVSQDSGLIVSVDSFSESEGDRAASEPDVVDLRRQTVLPGFVDTHVHCEC